MNKIEGPKLKLFEAKIEQMLINARTADLMRSIQLCDEIDSMTEGSTSENQIALASQARLLKAKRLLEKGSDSDEKEALAQLDIGIARLDPSGAQYDDGAAAKALTVKLKPSKKKNRKFKKKARKPLDQSKD